MARTVPPKPNAIRANKQPTEEIKGVAVIAPPLIDREEYSPNTLAWWDMWACSKQAEVFMPSDWMRLQLMVPLIEQYWLDPKGSTLAEIRLNEERLGATVRDRQNLRMAFKDEGKEVSQPEAAEASENVVRLRSAFGGS